jgi:hypothetical protein
MLAAVQGLAPDLPSIELWIVNHWKRPLSSIYVFAVFLFSIVTLIKSTIANSMA